MLDSTMQYTVAFRIILYIHVPNISTNLSIK